MRERPTRPGGPRARPRPRTPGPPPSARPATRRPHTTRTSAPRPPGRFTGRAIVLGVVLLALGLSYVLPLRVYLAQQAEIAELRSSQADQRARVAELAATAARWEDDDYIRIQARSRLYFAEPDETLLITVWEDDGAAPGPGLAPDDPPDPAEPWWERLWGSVEEADG